MADDIVRFSNGWNVARMQEELGKIAGKQDILEFDTKPTLGSTNPVTSNGILTAIYGKPPNVIQQGDDLDDYVTPNSYSCESVAVAKTLVNSPVSVGFRLEVKSTIASANTGYQLQFIYPNNNAGEFFERRRTSASGGWGGWYKFAGVPVDAINTSTTANSIALSAEEV